ncbi:DUF4232 domain-containing protein [Nonomuraea spiralis]|uniref:DUF4232 domain-containing protein n=1 Tax=Nonomuraea spiralis TaxID=46182 RepID=A0ABV5I9Z4_9ACTN|nr:DUF4232 domain-containing protein [Nonomuraea spiralis]GGT05738.1 hypothetical protein GCM10010176_057570 [Nonomuraea spiralis]
MRRFTTATIVAGLLLAGGAAPALAGESAAAPRCTAAQLQVRLGTVDAGAGNRNAPLVFTNRSRTACTLYGHPGLIMIDKQGDTLRTRVRRTTGPKRQVTVKPGATARTSLHWTVIETGDEKNCPSPSRLLVIPPDEQSYVNVPFAAGPVCDGGRLDVTPLT